MTSAIMKQYEALVALGFRLDMTRGQPGDDNLDLANRMLTIIDERRLVTRDGVDLRNYPGHIAGLAEARELFAEILDVLPSEVVAGNNSSLALLSNTLIWAMLRGMATSPEPWCRGRVRFIVTVPGYDRHFTMLESLGIEMVTVAMTPRGPDLDAVEALACSDPSLKGMLFVPTYSNPSGETICQEYVERLAALKSAAPDFTVFADDAYAVHHLSEVPAPRHRLLQACKAKGHPHRAVLFGSTSKMTFAGGGIGFLAASQESVKYLLSLMSTQMIGPNKLEQYRNAIFLRDFEGGVSGLMREHAALLRPKFQVVDEVFERALGGKGIAHWTKPQGGYFISVRTSRPIAKHVVELARGAGVQLPAAGSMFPHGIDPTDTYIRVAPTRPSLDNVRMAARIIGTCIALAFERADSSSIARARA